MSQLRFDSASYTKASAGMADAGDEIANRTEALLAQVSDLSVLGTNDILGSVCQMIYGTYLDIFSETVTGLSDSYGDTAARLAAAGRAYAEVEAANAQGASQMGEL